MVMVGVCVLFVVGIGSGCFAVVSVRFGLVQWCPVVRRSSSSGFMSLFFVSFVVGG